MRLKLLQKSKNAFLIAIFLVAGSLIHAQITLNTTIGSTGYTGTNTSGSGYGITFAIENTNSNPVILTDIGDWTQSSDNGSTFSLYYANSPIAGAPPLSFPATGWTLVASNTVMSISSPTLSVNPVIENMSFIIPANTTYHFSLVTSGARRYSGTGVGTCSPNIFNGNGINLLVGDYQIGGQYVGWSASNNPRFFTGFISLIPATPCTGTVMAGTATASANICANIPLSLAANGATSLATGLTSSWQSAPSPTGPWVDIAGAYSANYTLTSGISSPTSYRYWVTCANGGSTDTSNVITVNILPASQCYCTPGGTGTSYYIANFSTTGASQNVSISNSSFPAGGYKNNTATDTVTQVQLDSVNFNVAGFGSSTYGFAIWVDWNQDGTFDVSEKVFSTTSYTNSTSGSFAVPVTALPGVTRMRVGSHYLSSSGPNPCDNLTYTAFEDFSFHVVALQNCTGSVTAGTASGPASVCSSIPFTLTATGASLPATGQTGNWQSAPSATGPWTNISGATTPSFTVAGGISATTYYRYWIACSFSSSADTSNVITVNILPASQCYCTPGGTGTSYYIANFSTTGASQNVSISNSSFPAGGYKNNTATDTVTQVQLESVSFNVAGSGSNTYGFAIWVDWNQDGTFDVSEKVFSTTSYTNSTSGSFAVPVTALPGVTRMRVGLHYSNPSGPNPCDNLTSTAFEDFSFHVVALQNCTGSVTAGTASAPASVCSGIPFSLTATGTSLPATGQTGNWQSAPSATGPWTNISGATTPSFTVAGGISATTYYRYWIACSFSSSADTSNVITVNILPASQCYCTPGGTGTSYYIANFSTTGASQNVSVNNSSFPAGGYKDNTTTDTVTQVQLESVSFNVAGSGSNTYGFAIWVDWNQDGTFDVSEKVFSTTSYTNSTSGSFAVPVTALPGVTRMRVGLHYSNPSGPNPCDNLTSTAFEDFSFHVVALQNCTGSVMAGTASSPASVCSSILFTLTATGASLPATGQVGNWQVSSSPNGPWINLTGANTSSFTMPVGISATSSFRYWITCTNSNETDTSNIITVNIKPVFECYCEVTSTSNTTYGISNFTTTNGEVNINNSSSGGYYTDYSDQLYVSQYPGRSIDFSITSASGSAGMAIWIDWNQNGSFNDPGEQVYDEGAYTTNGAGYITVAANQPSGDYRMRVVANFLSSTPIPCGDLGYLDYGEAEDYTFVVICDTPTVNLGGDVTICAGNSITLDAGGNNEDFDIEWSDGSSNLTLEVTAAGTYYVTVTNGRCANIDSATVSVKQSPIVSLGGDTILCSGTTLTLDAGNNGADFEWSDGSTNQTLLVDAAGTYRVTVTAANSFCFAIDEINIEMDLMPLVSSIEIDNTSDCNFTFSMDNTDGLRFYQWNFGDGTAESTDATPTHTYAAQGTYTVTLSTGNACDTKTLTTIASCGNVGIDAIGISDATFKLYPNPSSDFITIENSGKTEVESIAIMNILGKVVYEDVVQNPFKQSIDVSLLPSGLYTLRVRAKGGFINHKFEVLR